jgi:ADP-dependent NAD(P)H-hydrate dehydratase / NAD(P)H-hydrate epimerase
MTAVLEGLKVVSAAEMARIEQIAYTQGASEQSFMENAGVAIAHAVEKFTETNSLPKNIALLVGKGNNGGDALAAGLHLRKQGFKVVALHLYPMENCTPLSQIMYQKFCSLGGTAQHVADKASLQFDKSAMILDGLIGTGFKGKAEGILALAIVCANQSQLPILAIDIPSGLNGTTGEVETVAIHATETVFLGLPKSGFFLNQGWDHVGVLTYASFGLEEKYIAQAKAIAYLPNEETLRQLLPPIKRTRHKYERGYVLAVAGSPSMPGAALLSCNAALHSGAGIVRLFHPQDMEALLSCAPFELIRQGWDQSNLHPISHEALRANAMLIGPGIGREKKAEHMVERILQQIDLPMVIDADALYFLAEHPEWKIPPGSVLTPHRGEMDRLLPKSSNKKDYLELCQGFAEEKGVTIVLKGAPTLIFHPGTSPLILTRGNPCMATAGSGDVLTGIIAAMIAQGLDARSASTLAVYLHGISGEAAAAALTSYCVTASDLTQFLPHAFKN